VIRSGNIFWRTRVRRIVLADLIHRQGDTLHLDRSANAAAALLYAAARGPPDRACIEGKSVDVVAMHV
jgi:hypothetical protein